MPSSGHRLLLTGGALLAAHAAATYLLPFSVDGGIRFWGLNALRYAPPLQAVLLYAAAVAGLLWISQSPRAAPEGSGAARAQPGEATPIRAIGSLPRWVGPVLVLGSVGLFVALRSRYGFLGDNLLRVREAEEGTGSPHEVGIMALYHGLTGIARRLSLGNARGVFQWVSFYAGLLYAAVAWQLARLVGGEGSGSPRRPLLLYAGLACAGVVELFCGYVEVYPLVLAFLLLTVWLALLAAEGRCPVLLPILILALTVALHRMAVLWAPAALAPLWIRLRARWILAGILGGGAAAGLLFAGKSSFLLPVLAGPDHPYALFSVPHLSDFCNAQVLGSTAATLLGPWALFRFLRARRPPRKCSVLAVSWAVPTLGLFFFRPILGGADWDILALAAPFGVLFAASVLLPETAADPAFGGGTRNDAGTAATAGWVALGVLLSALNTLPWLSVQAGDGSIPRIRQLIDTDRADYYRDHPAPLHLAFLFAANRLPRLQEEELRRGLTEYPEDPRFPYNLAVLARARQDWPEAERYAALAYGRVRGYLAPLDILYDAYRVQGRREDQILVGRTILEADALRRGEAQTYFPPARIERIRRDLEALSSP